MIKQAMDRPRYRIAVEETAPGKLTISFAGQGTPGQRAGHAASKPTSLYVVDVSEDGGQIVLDWHGSEPNVEGATQQDFEDEARTRLLERRQWIGAVAELISQVEQWARGLGWSTRRIEKKLEDSRIGNYKAPALVMQQDTTRTILEPVSRTVPGGRGLAELSLMPSFADIASFHLRDDGWFVHYAFPRSSAIVTDNEPEVRRLSAEVLGQVLAGMTEHDRQDV